MLRAIPVLTSKQLHRFVGCLVCRHESVESTEGTSQVGTDEQLCAAVIFALVNIKLGEIRLLSR